MKRKNNCLRTVPTIFIKIVGTVLKILKEGLSKKANTKGGKYGQNWRTLKWTETGVFENCST